MFLLGRCTIHYHHQRIYINGDKSKILHTNCVGKGHHCFYFIRGDWLHWPRTVQVETRQSLERERRKAKEKGTAVRRLVASTLSKRIWHLKIRSAYYQCLTQEVTGNYGQTQTGSLPFQTRLMSWLIKQIGVCLINKTIMQFSYGDFFIYRTYKQYHGTYFDKNITQSKCFF